MKSENQTPTPSKLTAITALIAGWLTAIFMLYVVFPSTVYAWATIALFLLCAYKISTKKSGFILTAVLTAIAFFALGTSAETLAHVLSIVASAVIGGAMLTEIKSGIIFIFFTGAIYTAAALLSSPTGALTVLTGLPMAISLAVCARLKASRVTSVCAVSAVFLSTWILPTAITFYLQYGNEAAEQFKLLLAEFRTVQTDTMVSLMSELFADSEGELSGMIDKETVATLVDTVINLFPAILIVLSNIVAFSAHTLSLHARERLGKLYGDNEKCFALSKVSAWLYIISFSAVLFGISGSETARIFTLAMQNINVILTPSFLFAGISSISVVMHAPEGKLGTVHTLIAILALLYCGTFLIYPIVAFGVIRTLNSGKKPPEIPNS